MFNIDIGIDLGTANTLVYVKGRDMISTEPSVVAIDKNTKKILAVGNEAKKMLLNSELSITEICYQCGFSDSSYFGKVFRKAYGMAPREYRAHSSFGNRL